MKSINPKSLSIKERHGLLLGSIGPRPIAWVSTIDEKGVPNLAPFSFFNIFSSNPPILIFSPARSGRTNRTKHTYDNSKTRPEAVVNIVNHELLDRMVLTSLEYDKEVNEFERAGLTMLDSIKVKPPRVAESPVQLECKVLEVKELGLEGAAGNLIICEVVMMHFNDSILTEEGRIDQEKIDLIGRLGGAWYSRASGDALFEVRSNPMNTVVGYGSLPEFISNSPDISAKELKSLINAGELPDETEVNDFKLEKLAEIFSEYQENPGDLQKRLVEKAKEYLRKEELDNAWRTILAYNP
ncbi:MAG: flavin reductase family protein [Flavobacteriales bacterium]|nr:flavin reductase family protein [Flavobacteriales bacterium]